MQQSVLSFAQYCGPDCVKTRTRTGLLQELNRSFVESEQFVFQLAMKAAVLRSKLEIPWLSVEITEEDTQ